MTPLFEVMDHELPLFWYITLVFHSIPSFLSSDVPKISIIVVHHSVRRNR